MRAVSRPPVRPGPQPVRSLGQRWIKAVVLSRLRGAVVAAGSAIVGQSLGALRRHRRALICGARLPVSAAIQPVLYVRVRVGPPGHAARLQAAGAGGARRRSDDDIVSEPHVNHCCCRRLRVLSRRSN